jgi:hypothetical protein
MSRSGCSTCLAELGHELHVQLASLLGRLRLMVMFPAPVLKGISSQRHQEDCQDDRYIGNQVQYRHDARAFRCPAARMTWTDAHPDIGMSLRHPAKGRGCCPPARCRGPALKLRVPPGRRPRRNPCTGCRNGRPGRGAPVDAVYRFRWQADLRLRVVPRMASRPVIASPRR